MISVKRRLLLRGNVLQPRFRQMFQSTCKCQLWSLSADVMITSEERLQFTEGQFIIYVFNPNNQMKAANASNIHQKHHAGVCRDAAREGTQCCLLMWTSVALQVGLDLMMVLCEVRPWNPETLNPEPWPLRDVTWFSVRGWKGLKRTQIHSFSFAPHPVTVTTSRCAQLWVVIFIFFYSLIWASSKLRGNTGSLS